MEFVESVSSKSLFSDSLQPIQINKLPSFPSSPDFGSALSSKNWYIEPHDYNAKMTQRRRFKPVLAGIYENDYKPAVAGIYGNDRMNSARNKFEFGGKRGSFRRQHLEVVYGITRAGRRLCNCVFKNDTGLVIRLLDMGISPNSFDCHRRTPLHIAVSKGYSAMVQLLLDRGADPNIKDGLGNSSLHLAACTNNVEISSMLIRAGASVVAVDFRGRSPIELAQSKLRLLSQNPDGLVKSKINQVIEMLLLFLERRTEQESNEASTALLTTVQSRLEVTDAPEQISNEMDNLSKILDQMGSLTINK